MFGEIQDKASGHINYNRIGAVFTDKHCISCGGKSCGRCRE